MSYYLGRVLMADGGYRELTLPFASQGRLREIDRLADFDFP